MWLYAEVRTLGDIPRHYARTTPDGAALIDDSGTISWADLDRRANRTANALAAIGVGTGDRVAYLGQNSTRYFEVLFATSKLGAAIVPLNWRLAVPELEAVARDAMPRVLIADREYAEVAATVVARSGLACPVIGLDSGGDGPSELDELVAAASDLDPDVDVNPWWTAILMYTSGTTGRPKGVQLSHQNYLYLRLSEHLDPSFHCASSDRMLTVMPLFHAVGTALSLQALYYGAAVAVHRLPGPGELIDLIARRRPTILPLVPTVIRMLLDHPKAPTGDYSSVRLVVYAGSPIGVELLSRALDWMDCDFAQFYGATETAAGVTFLRPDDHRSGTRLDSCGSLMPLAEIRVVDAAGEELPDGQIGELLIRAPSLTTGYFNQPEATASAFRDGWYHSGDAGHRDRDGYFTIVDRVKDMIITGGENVYSVEVEQALQQIEGVQSCAAVGLPDPTWGERIVGMVVLHPGSELTGEEIISRCRELIASYKVPKQITLVDALPITASGKIMKHEIRSQLLARSSSDRQR